MAIFYYNTAGGKDILETYIILLHAFGCLYTKSFIAVLENSLEILCKTPNKVTMLNAELLSFHVVCAQEHFIEPVSEGFWWCL